MYARRSHPARAADVPRRVLRHRRVQHPQGVRLVEDRRRDGQPDQPGARSHPRLRRRGRARRRSSTTTSTCRSPRPDAEPVYLTQMKALLRRHPKTHRSSGPTSASAASSIRSQVSAEAAERSPSQLDIVEAMLDRPGARARQLRHLVGRGREVRRRLAGVDRSGSPTLLNRYPGPLPVRHRHGRAGRPGAVLRGVRHVGAGVAAAHAGGEPQGAQGQLRAALRRRTPDASARGRRRTRNEFHASKEQSNATTIGRTGCPVRSGWRRWCS